MWSVVNPRSIRDFAYPVHRFHIEQATVGEGIRASKTLKIRTTSLHRPADEAFSSWKVVEKPHSHCEHGSLGRGCR